MHEQMCNTRVKEVALMALTGILVSTTHAIDFWKSPSDMVAELALGGTS